MTQICAGEINYARVHRTTCELGIGSAGEVNDLVKQFDGMAGMMKQMAGKGVRERMKMAKEMQAQAMANPGGKLAKTKQGTGKRLSSKERQKLKKQREKEARRKKRSLRTGPQD